MPAAAETGGTFRDWALTCTPGLRCTAETFAPAGAALYGLGLERSVSADAPLRLVLSLPSDASIAGPVTLSVAGADPVSLSASAFEADAAGRIRSSGLSVPPDLLGRMRDAATVRAAVDTTSGRLEQTFSLSGLVAALRKMDDDQGRIGTPTALTDRGDKSLPDRAGLPADIATPEDLPAPVRALWQAGGDCADRGDVADATDLGFSMPMGEGTRLFVIACGMPGAYNYPSRLYQYSDGAGTADAVPLVWMTTEGPTADLAIWNVDLDGDTLSSFFKGRGIGDCGRFSTWRVEPDTAQVVLVEAREKEDCDGDAGDGPESWPRLWPPS
ncbi:hypothetical protein ASF65_08250 [Aureimonas sp. Leaf324]|nr:hypothetical protein ASF65_08250 [Aureimonas sp. Leaf324]